MLSSSESSTLIADSKAAARLSSNFSPKDCREVEACAGLVWVLIGVLDAVGLARDRVVVGDGMAQPNSRNSARAP